MAVTWLTAFLDTAEPDAPAVEEFWVGVTGWPLSERHGEHLELATLVPPQGDATVKVQVVGQEPPNGMHLEVHTEDLAEMADRVASLGATVRWDLGGYAVCRSPGALVFCVVPHEASVRPSPVRWPGGASLVDQVCLDIPVARFDVEAAFWAAVTGWPHVPGGSPEFDRLLPPPGQPWRILLQRTGDDGTVRMHLDLASEDRTAEVARHVGLGARLVRETQGWTTLLDPSGRAYCVTRRRPATGTLP